MVVWIPPLSGKKTVALVYHLNVMFCFCFALFLFFVMKADSTASALLTLSIFLLATARRDNFSNEGGFYYGSFTARMHPLLRTNGIWKSLGVQAMQELSAL